MIASRFNEPENENLAKEKNQDTIARLEAAEEDFKQISLELRREIDARDVDAEKNAVIEHRFKGKDVCISDLSFLMYHV